MSIMIGIDHGYYAIKTAHCSFPAGLTSYGEHEPYTRQTSSHNDFCIPDLPYFKFGKSHACSKAMFRIVI